MNSFLTLIKRYKVFICLLFFNLLIMFFYREIGIKSFEISFSNVLSMLAIIPPIFVLLGLMDVWIKRETMIKYMGEKSGIRGVLIAFFLGSAAAGPLYAAFPMAWVLLQKGSSLFNVFVFIGAWSTTKIPLLLVEMATLGTKFTLIRLALSIPGIALIAFLTQRLLSKMERDEILAALHNEEA